MKIDSYHTICLSTVLNSSIFHAEFWLHLLYIYILISDTCIGFCRLIFAPWSIHLSWLPKCSLYTGSAGWNLQVTEYLYLCDAPWLLLLFEHLIDCTWSFFLGILCVLERVLDSSVSAISWLIRLICLNLFVMIKTSRLLTVNAGPNEFLHRL